MRISRRLDKCDFISLWAMMIIGFPIFYILVGVWGFIPFVIWTYFSLCLIVAIRTKK